jgi:hypothetical protein
MDLRFESPQRQEYAYEQLRSTTSSSVRKNDERVAQGLEKYANNWGIPTLICVGPRHSVAMVNESRASAAVLFP